MKKLSALFVLIVALLSLASIAYADDGFRINGFEVDGMEIESSSDTIYVERGETVDVTVYYSGINDGSDDVRIKAWVGGYEYGDIEDVTSIFKVKEGTRSKKTLHLTIPEDIDASDEYTIRIKMYDDDDEVTEKAVLRVESLRHYSKIYDVIMNPSTLVKAGQPLFISVRVENLGDNVEDSIKVTASIPELGIVASEYVDELITQLDDEDSKRDSASTNDLMLFVPEDAKEGEYTVKVALEYNRGHSVEEQEYTVFVKGGNVAETPVLVNVDTPAKTVEAGTDAVFTVSMANLASETKTFTFDVIGEENWGTARVDPQSLTLQADSNGEVTVYVSPAEKAEGTKTLTFAVKDGENVVKETTLTVSVEENSGYEMFKKVLEIGFIVLLIILVVLGIVMVAKKLSGSDEEAEEQSYY